MTNSTDEYWSINGTSLQQFGWSVATIGGSRYDLPPRRGENIQLAYRPGMVHRTKVADSRVISLVMWVTGTTPGTGATVADPALRWNDSWDFLRRLVWKPDGAQVELTRRWYLTVDSTKTLVAATALAEVGDTMSPTMTGRTRADFTMTLLLADPYFYGSEVSTNISRGNIATVTNPGHDLAGWANFQVEFIGPLTDPKLTNLSVSPDVWVKYDGTISSGHSVTLDLSAFTAFNQSGVNVIGKISHSGARSWMVLQPTANTLQLTGDSGAGSVQVRFQPPYV